MQSIVPKVTAGSLVDGDFKPFFDMLKMNLWYVWNIQSSVFYLTQKLLADASFTDVQKYSALSSMIFSELKDHTQCHEIPKQKPILIGSDGNPINSEENITKQVTTFFCRTKLAGLPYNLLYNNCESVSLGFIFASHSTSISSKLFQKALFLRPISIPTSDRRSNQNNN